MTEGSCTQDSVCTVCGYTVKAKGHMFEDGVCTVCGLTVAEASRADASVQASLAAESETQTTEPPIDADTLLRYADTMEALLQDVHDAADDSISKTADERAQILTQAVAHLQTVLDTVGEAEQFCASDARLNSVKKTLEPIRKAIRSDATIRSFGGDSVKTAVTVRADATTALKALAAYRKAVSAL